MKLKVKARVIINITFLHSRSLEDEPETVADPVDSEDWRPVPGKGGGGASVNPSPAAPPLFSLLSASPFLSHPLLAHVSAPPPPPPPPLSLLSLLSGTPPPPPPPPPPLRMPSVIAGFPDLSQPLPYLFSACPPLSRLLLYLFSAPSSVVGRFSAGRRQP